MRNQVQYKIEDGVEYRRCITCGKWKLPNRENFHRNHARTDGLDPYCKSCRKQKTQYHYDPQKQTEYRNAFLERNPHYHQDRKRAYADLFSKFPKSMSDEEIAKRTGYTIGLVMEHRIGIRRLNGEGDSNVHKGDAAELLVSTRLWEFGIPHEFMRRFHLYDILLDNGCRVEVKSAHHPLLPPSQKVPFYIFNLATKARGNYTDFFVLVIMEDEPRFYVVPADQVPPNGTIRISGLTDEQRQRQRSSKYDQYMNRFDLLR